MTLRTFFSCDFCGDENENVKEMDYLNVLLGEDKKTLKQICRKCIGAIDQSRGRNPL